jgi:DNA-directed RNA polymerase subunit N (RpoN/RPB10)
MLTPILCITCGASLGDAAPVYVSVRRNRMGKLYGTSRAATLPEGAAGDPDHPPEVMSDIFAALKIHRACCKTRLATAVLFPEQLGG